MRKYTFQRTITYTQANVLVFDKVTKQTETKTITLVGKFTKQDDKRVICKARRTLEQDNIKVLMITGYSYTEQLFGMALQDFLKYAVPIKK